LGTKNIFHSNQNRNHKLTDQIKPKAKQSKENKGSKLKTIDQTKGQRENPQNIDTSRSKAQQQTQPTQPQTVPQETGF
jgi:hypothetical protein